MNNTNNSSGIGALIFIAIIIFSFIAYLISSVADNSSTKNSKTNYSKDNSNSSYYMPSYTPPAQEEIVFDVPEIWSCVDATSYDGNSHNDNHCTSNKGGDRYVDDCTAVSLDPSYYPSQRGASYYNGCAR